MKDYDFLFVVGGLPYISYPSGGENIIFQLCSRLKTEGYKVGLAVMKNCNKYLYNVKKDPKILSKQRKHPIVRELMFSSLFNKVGGRAEKN